MKEWMLKNKTIFLFVFLFFLFLFWNLIVTDFYADEIWNFGFSYAIRKGEIPYLDFNMVITPLYPFIMAFFFLLFGSNMLIFHVIHAFLLTGMCYVLYQLIAKKMFLILPILFIPYPATYPSYNIMILFFFVLLLWMEEKKIPDIWIGIVLGLSILTKQSIGLCFCFASLYYYKDLKRVGKRILGVCIPCSIFLMYLLVTHSFSKFFDLCFLGLIDFSSNHSSFNIYYLFGIAFLFVTIFMIRKEKKIDWVYGLMILSMMIPSFEIYHFILTLFCILILLMIKEFSLRIHPVVLFLGIYMGASIIHLSRIDSFLYPNPIPHLEYRFLSQGAISYIEKVNSYLDTHEDVIFLSNNAYLFRIVRDEKISSFDLINYGNYGYHGSEKLVKELQKRKGSLVMIQKSDFSNLRQTDKNVLQYVVEHGKYQESYAGFDIYLLGEEEDYGVS